QITQLEKLQAEGNAAAVKKEAERLLAEAEEPRARTLLEWADASLAGVDLAPRSKFTWVWATLPALVVAAIGGGYWWIHRPLPASLDVSPGKLAFLWKPGPQSPEPKIITVHGKGGALNWSAKSGQDWLIAEPVGGSSSSQLGVSINVSKIDIPKNGPAELTGLVVVTGGGLMKTVDVKLTVQAQPVVEHHTILDVSPEDLTFHWKPGERLPEPKVVSIQSHGTEVHLKPPDLPWLGATLSKDESQLTVSVNTYHITGSHQGLLQLTAGDAFKSVDVHLNIEPADTPKTGPGGGGSGGGGSGKKEKDTTTSTSGQTQQKPAEPQARMDVRNCHSPEYEGTWPDSYKLTWSGQLAPGGMVWLSRDLSWRDPNGPPSGWKGRYALPGCAVDISTSVPLTQVQQATPENGFSRLLLRNDGPSPITSFTLTWTVK
ncbi:MAG TPA: hypothetical protein VML19_01025, partial [Verrucomicrobiae bacterium]|nr:hypothetical protein [Verrucomicrobiae bacterium]